MAAQSLVIACTSTPTAVAGTFGDPSQHGYIRIKLKSLAGTAYLGSSSVTTEGYPLTTSEAAQDLALVTGETLWAASSSGATVSVAVLRLGETS